MTQCRWSAKQTIPLSVLARNQTKGLEWNRDLRQDRKWGRKVRSQRSEGSEQGNANRESWKKEPTEDNWRRVTQRGSRQRTAEEISRAKGSEEDRQDEFAVLSRQRSAVRKTVRDELAFLVARRSFAKTTRQR